MTSNAQALVDDIGELISLPEVVLRINDMVNDEQATATDIGKVISQDPALSTRILRIANSPLYGNMRQIDSISRAVTILGTKQIRDLTLSTTAAKVFEGIPNHVISVADFWHHSLYCALLARALAEDSRKANADTLFTAGLLHDIGHLVMFNRVPEQATAAIMLTVQGEASLALIDAEKQTLGFEHSEVGASLARQWHLPDILVDCIAWHHHPAQARAHGVAVAHVHIANAIANLPYSDVPTEQDLARVDAEAWALTGLDPHAIGEAVRQAQAQIDEMQTALFGESSG